MIRNELFHVWSKENRQAIQVFGVRQTEFLVMSPDGWVWVPMHNFNPMRGPICKYRDQIKYVHSDGRAGMCAKSELILST